MISTIKVYLLWNILHILYDRKSLVALKEDIMSNSNIESNYEDRENGAGSSSDDDSLKGDKQNQLGDFYFGDAEIDPLDAEHDQYDFIGLQMDSKTVQEDNDWEVPVESITLRHEIVHQPIDDDPYIPVMAPIPNKLSKKYIIVWVIVEKHLVLFIL